MTDTAIHPGQFRLSRIQLVNWGTFDGYRDLPVPRKGFLITGGSGSGKSTLIDAVSAVLVPPDRVHYNAAAQQELKRGQGRTLVSYIRGAWRRREDAETGALTSTFLRPKATYTVVALTYDDAVGKEWTLAAFFYLKAGDNSADTVKRLYGLFPGDQDVDEMHRFLSRGIDTRAVKAHFKDATFTDRYAVFAKRFRPRVGITSQEAQLLLHRTQSAKSLTSLDQLFREYMLSTPGTFDTAAEAVAQFDELRQAYHRVQEVKEQIDVLEPLPELYSTRTKAEADREQATAMKSALPAVRDRIHAESVREEIRSLSTRESAARGRATQLDRERERLTDRLMQARVALNSFGEGQLHTIDLQIQLAEQSLGQRRSTRGKVTAAVTALGGEMPGSTEDVSGAEGYAELLGGAAEIRDEHDRVVADLNEQLYEASARRSGVRGQLAEVRDELESLGRRSSNIDAEYIRIRQRLCEHLGVAEKEIPFAGELIDVLPRHHEWEPVIQRELGSFAVHLLVPQVLVGRVSRWINNRDLGVRLDYRAVPGDVSAARASGSARALSNKVAVTDHPLGTWVRNEILSSHEYECVADVDELEQVPPTKRAVTITGLVRNRTARDGSTRFVKNDRHRLGDRSRYRLGSTNHDKVELLRSRVAELEQQDNAADRLVGELRRRIGQRQTMLGHATVVLEHGWEDVDTTADEQQIKRLREQRALLAASPEAAELNAEVEFAEAASRKADEEHRAAQHELSALDTRLEERRKELTQLEERPAVPVDERTAADVEELLTGLTRRVSATNVLEVSDKALTRLEQRITRASRSIEQANSDMVRVLAEFRERWPAERAEIQADASFAGEAITRLTNLRTERLAEFRDRFLTLMNGTSVRNLSILSNDLRRAREDIISHLNPVNHSLSRSPFDEGRWLRIDVRDHRGEEVMKFLRDLVAATSGGLSAADAESAEARYRRLAVILDRLGSEEAGDRRWRNTVLDTRRHVRFIGVEVDDAGEVVNTHVDSASLSGGQAQKLVFFCLAAALRYQLAEPDEDYPRYATVVLDEAFDRADPVFTRTAMNVFREFGFHMVLATPLKLIQTLSPYVDGTIVVNYDERADADGVVRARSSYATIATGDTDETS